MADDHAISGVIGERASVALSSFAAV